MPVWSARPRKGSEPPSPDDVGVDAVGSLPEMTAVGGTKLSTGPNGEWHAEQAWYNGPLVQGTAAWGVDTFRSSRVAIRRGGHCASQSTAGPRCLGGVRSVHRSADRVEPTSHGRRWHFSGCADLGGPCRADESKPRPRRLQAVGEHLNPLLYKVAKTAILPGFHDINLGGNAIMLFIPMVIDMVTSSQRNIATVRDIQLL